MKLGVAMVEPLAVGFALLFLASVAVFAVAMRRIVAAPRPADAPRPDPHLKLVARVVVDEQGQRVGETVRAEGDDMILKQGATFLAVPRSVLREDGERLRAEGVDWALAKEKGEAWRARQENAITDELGQAAR